MSSEIDGIVTCRDYFWDFSIFAKIKMNLRNVNQKEALIPNNYCHGSYPLVRFRFDKENKNARKGKDKEA